MPEEEWNLELMCGGVWTIFPHISFAGGHGGGLVSQLFPGRTPGTSVTIQNYYTSTEPSEETRAGAGSKADFLEMVVRDEDYYTGLRLQRALDTRRASTSCSAATRAAGSASTRPSTSTSPAPRRDRRRAAAPVHS